MEGVDEVVRRTRQQQILAAQYAVSHVLTQTTELDAAAAGILRVIGEELGWQYGAFWVVSRPDDVLRCVGTWRAQAVVFPQFEALTKRTAFTPGSGLPGRVWASSEPVWITDVVRDANFARARDAASEGLHAGLGFPILSGGRAIGVIEFFSLEIREPDNDLLAMMAAIGSQIGQFLERKRAEDSVRESEARKAAVLESALDAIITMDREGRVVEFNPAAERTFGYSQDEVVGREMAELIIPPYLREAHRRGLARYLATEEGVVIGNRVELTAMRSDGTEFPVELTVTRIPLDGPPMFTGYVRDITDRVRAVEDLRLSETRFRTMIEQSPLSIQILAPDGHTRQVNRAWEELWGVKLEQIPGYNVLQDPQLIERGIMPYIHQAFAGQAAVIPPIKYEPEKTVAGVSEVPHRWVRAFIYPVKDELGQVREVILLHDDITAQVHAAEALRESQEQLQAILDNSPAVVYVKDTQGRFLLTNRRFHELFQVSGEQVVGKTEYDIFPKETADTFRANDQKVLDTGGPLELEEVIPQDDGPHTYLSVKFPLYDSSGTPRAVCGISTDITERKRVEVELRRSEASLADAQRIAHLGSWEWNAATDELVWSDETYRIFGITPQQPVLTYDTFGSRVHPDDREYVRRANEESFNECKPYDVEFRIVRPDGEARTVHEQAEVVLDSDGSPVRMIGTVQDITERKREEEEREELLERVEQALQLRNQFLSIASHELKTPVTLLKGYVQVLQRQAQRTGASGMMRPLDVISRQIDRMNRLIAELLDVSRIESGRIGFESAAFDLNSAIEEVISETKVSTPGFEVRLHEQDRNVQVVGDRVRIQQVMTNLLMNAVKYSDQRREADVTIQRDGEHVTVSVTDYGIGIPKEQQSHVFQLYFRAPNAPADNYGGLGLGLYISKTIVDRHGGTIGVESEEGKGSTFYFSLPLAGSGSGGTT